METVSSRRLARRNGAVIPLLLWYVLLSSHVLLVIPAAGVEQAFVDWRNPREHERRQDTDQSGDSSDPLHTQHSRAEAYLCAACESSAMLAETVPTVQFHRLVAARSIVARSTTFVGAVRVLDHPVPDSPLPDPPLKVPIFFG